MPLYALEGLGDAWQATRAFLWPVDRSRWAKLALVVLLAAGPGANFNALQFNVPADRVVPPDGFMVPGFPAPVLFILAALVGVVLVFGLLLLLVGSVMEFVLVESLRRETVEVRRYWGRRWRQGVRLFGFRVVLGLVVLGSTAAVAGLFLLPAAFRTAMAPVPVFVIALLLFPVLLVLAVAIGLVHGFTTVFVVPVMVLEDGGVLAGWRRLWPTIVTNPWQYATYAVVGFMLSIAGGILVGIVVGVVVLVLLVPFGLLGAIGFVLLSVAPPLGFGILAVVGVLFALSVLAVVALAQVPVVAYLRYYALLVLGDIEPAFDLIPERRAAVRETPAETG